MSKTLLVARQVEFDSSFVSEVKRLGSLATPGSYATFEGNSNSLTVTFHGKEIQARRRFDFQCASQFSFTANGKDMLDLFKSFSEGTLTVKDTSISFKSGHAKMNRNLSVDVQAPVFPDFSMDNLSPLPQTTFRDAAFASYAAAQTNNEDSSERISILLNNDTVSIVATNGQMAVCVESPTDYTGPEEEYLLHPRIINPLAPLTAKDEAPAIYIGSDGRRYMIRFGDYEITASIPAQASKRSSIDGPMKTIVPLPSMLATIDTAALDLYLERAKLLDGGFSMVRPVIILADPSNGVVYAKHESSLGDIQDMFEAEIGGASFANIPIGMSLKNVSEVCSHVKSEKMTLAIRGQQMPVTVSEEIGETKVMHVMLPVVPRTRCSEDTTKEEISLRPQEDDTSIVTPSDFEDAG